MLRGEPAEVSGDYAVLTIMGPGAGAAEIDGWASATAAATMRAFGVDVIVPRDRIFAAAADLRARGGVCGGMGAHEAVRIAAGRPRFGLDTDHRTIPHEAGWIETAVHLSKGCYRGQETVARVHNLGHPPRRLVFLHLDGSEDRLPAHGDPVTADDATVGFVGSVARHFELGPVGLGLIKRTVPVDAALRAGGVPAAQEVVVPPDAGANVTITLKRRSVLTRAGDPGTHGRRAWPRRGTPPCSPASPRPGSAPAVPRRCRSSPPRSAWAWPSTARRRRPRTSPGSARRPVRPAPR